MGTSDGKAASMIVSMRRTTMRTMTLIMMIMRRRIRLILRMRRRRQKRIKVMTLGPIFEGSHR